MLAAAVAFVALAPIAAEGHGRSVSYSTWRIEGRQIAVRARVAALDLSAVESLAAASAREAERRERQSNASDAALEDAYVASRVHARSNAGPCTARTEPHGAAADDGWRSIGWTLECPSADRIEVRVDVLFDALPSHLHFARVDFTGGASFEKLLTAEHRTWLLGDATRAGATNAARGSSFATYVALGIEHILSGYDHVAFLVALLLLARTLGEVALLASAFTVAHSITLALAALGLAHPSARAIEALIGFSIALVAIENVWLLSGRRRFVPLALAAALLAMAVAARAGSVALSPLVLVGLALFCFSHFGLLERARDATRVRALVAFCFGLAHGFGFAGVLGEVVSDPSRLVRALLGFNAGVELGQLAIVTLLWPLLALAQRTRGGAVRLLVAEVGSAVVCALGTFWFLARSFG
jgi:hypothetical protein